MSKHNSKVICPTTGDKITRFELKYGCHVKDFAEAEGTTPAAIHMRVMKFGTPYQRRARPTVCEILTGYTKRYIATHIDYHYNSIAQKIKTRQGQQDIMEQLFKSETFGQTEYEFKINNDMHTGYYGAPMTAHQRANYIRFNKVDNWSWLMPEHEDYDTWRYDHTVMLLENKYGRL